MNYIVKMWLGACLCLIIGKQVAAQSDSTSIYVNQVLVPATDSARSLALHRLVSLRDPSTFPILEAIHEKKIYLLYGQPVTTGEVEELANGEEVFPLFYLFPENKPVLEADGKPKKLSLTVLKKVDISRTERLVLNSILPYLNLANAEPKKRIIAY